jgi:dTDP-4-amino-4,6-dideoxygalactose transaminase
MIPLIRPKLPSSNKIKALYEEIQKSNIYTNYGPFYQKACDELSKVYQGHPVLVNNGTASIELILRTTLPKGSRVALPDFTFIASLNAVVSAGMVPVLLDVDKDTLCINQKSLIKYKKSYDCIMVVSPFGFFVDVDSYDKLAKRLNKKIVYDFAGGFGLKISNKNPTSFSLHATKTLPIGEGGIAMFQNSKHQLKAKKLAAFNLDDNKLPIDQYGTNFKLDELHCGILIEQLSKFDNMAFSRTKLITLMYFTPEVFYPPNDLVFKGCPQLPILKCKQVKKAIEILALNGIMSRRYYYPFLNTIKGIKILAKSSKIGDFLALPKDVTNEELLFIQNVLKGIK